MKNFRRIAFVGGASLIFLLACSCQQSAVVSPTAPPVGVQATATAFIEPETTEPDQASFVGSETPASIVPKTACREKQSGIRREVFHSGWDILVIEVLRDDLLHFEYTRGQAPSVDQPLVTSPMVLKTDYPGPECFYFDGKANLATNSLWVEADEKTLCVHVTDLHKSPNLLLATTCPKKELVGGRYSLAIDSPGFNDLYGLGEQFTLEGSKSLDWEGKKRSPGNEFGNAMQSFANGWVGNAQMPILYALNTSGDNYAIFVDSLAAQEWNFFRSPWKIALKTKQLRWYLLSGPDLPDLRKDYLELTGRPPVPPKQFFGMWISEFGYDSWEELEEKLKSLRKNHFPVDGFVLDLQWFGGIWPSSSSHMGALTWDQVHFPNPMAHIQKLADQGVGLMTIEESFVSLNLKTYAQMAEKNFLVQQCQNCKPVDLGDKWWGKGGMVDWTNPAAADFWHDQKRQPLVDAGIVGHWTDLGEPENFDENAHYTGIPDQGLHQQEEVHNLYNLSWSESIARGYSRNGVERRPFILSRSGTSGSQRYGVSMWSGDMASNFMSLQAQQVVAGQMSLSGIDYFGSDIGGFARGNIGSDVDALYTRWFAAGSLLDVPLRPHTENLCNCKETAPDRVGDRDSNLANLRLRYALSPTLYSLAFRAYLFGEAYAPPLVYAYQFDPQARQVSDQRLLGNDLLVAPVTGSKKEQRDVYLPAGKWINYHTNTWFDSDGEWLEGVSATVDGLFRIPLFVRAGAILPMAPIDDQTSNILGQRADGKNLDELILRIYAAEGENSFTLYEDDGQSIAYLEGTYRVTHLTQHKTANQLKLTIAVVEGEYLGAPSERRYRVYLFLHSNSARRIAINGEEIPLMDDEASFMTATSAWRVNADQSIELITPALSVAQDQVVEVDLVAAPE